MQKIHRGCTSLVITQFTGLKVLSCDDIGLSYAKTLRDGGSSLCTPTTILGLGYWKSSQVIFFYILPVDLRPSTFIPGSLWPQDKQQ